MRTNNYSNCAFYIDEKATQNTTFEKIKKFSLWVLSFSNKICFNFLGNTNYSRQIRIFVKDICNVIKEKKVVVKTVKNLNYIQLQKFSKTQYYNVFILENTEINNCYFKLYKNIKSNYSTYLL